MEQKVREFDAVEYAVFGVMLGISALIGIYYGFVKKKDQDTVEGYLLGGKKMGLFPISMSLTSSFVSGNTILGIPAEIYTYGSQYALGTLVFLPVGWICAYVFTPVFYKLQVISVYEYMELRFNAKVRKLVSVLYTISLMTYIPVVIYGPALALNQVSGLDIHSMSLLICGICIFYTTIGGLKAVVWSDALQTAVMILSSLVVAIIGTMQAGGLSNILEAARQGDRLEFLKMDPDPRRRVTFWTMLIGLTVGWTGSSTISPSAIQRFVALSSLRKAQWSVFNFTFGCFGFFVLSSYMGLVLYARYKNCDPLTSGLIQAPDQILPYFIIDATGSYRGLPGLFLAGVVSAALSTMSTGLNTVAGTMYEDMVEPLLGKTTDARASKIIKVLAALFGVVCVILTLFIGKLGSLIELANSFGGLTAGSILGIFVLGLFFPPATSLGALTGAGCGLFTLAWVVIGSRTAVSSGEIVYSVKPVSVARCTHNLTGLDLHFPREEIFGKVFPLFELSIFYYVLLGCSITVIVGLITSYLTGANKVESVDRSLLTPVIHSFLPEYRPVSAKEEELATINH